MNEPKDVRNELLDMLEDLDTRLEKITADVRHSEQPLSKDFEEQASETENDQVVDQLGLSARSMVAKIKKALGKLDQGDYGICVECGRKISPQRLKILPYTEVCIACAQELEDGAE